MTGDLAEFVPRPTAAAAQTVSLRSLEHTLGKALPQADSLRHTT